MNRDRDHSRLRALEDRLPLSTRVVRSLTPPQVRHGELVVHEDVANDIVRLGVRKGNRTFWFDPTAIDIVELSGLLAISSLPPASVSYRHKQLVLVQPGIPDQVVTCLGNGLGGYSWVAGPTG